MTNWLLEERKNRLKRIRQARWALCYGGYKLPRSWIIIRDEVYVQDLTS